MDASMLAKKMRKLAEQVSGVNPMVMMNNSPNSDLNYLAAYAQTLPVEMSLQYKITELRVLTNYTMKYDAAFLTNYVGDVNPWRF